MHSNKDILTLAYDRAGNFLWKIYFNGDFDGDDEGTGITADANGNIFVAGVSQITDSTYQKVTIKYKTDYFLVPQDTVPAPSSLLFYPNAGQIIDTQDSIRRDVSFYTINQFPKLYFHQDSISFVMAHVDSDTATADTLERITMNFADGNMAHGGPYTGNTHDTDQVLNYFLGHCPDGITGVTGSEKIMYREVYDKTNVIFSNNNAGMKFQIIMDPGFEPQALLHFTGHQSLQLVNNSDLQVSGVLGSFTYERPLVYQLDEYGGRISLGWLASYYIVDSADVAFVLPGNYDNRLTLVVECARPLLPNSNFGSQNLDWSTCYGGVGFATSMDAVTDNNHNKIVVGSVGDPNFPLIPGANPFQGTSQGGYDAFIVKYNFLGQPISATYVGGQYDDFGEGVAVDANDHIYLVGYTSSGDFPRKDFDGGSNDDYYQHDFVGSTGLTYNGFIFELEDNIVSHTQSKVWGTYFAASSILWLEKAKIDASDNLFIVGTTISEETDDFPVPVSQPVGAYFQECGPYLVQHCTTTTGITTVTTSSTAGLTPGSLVFGIGIQGSTKIASITNLTTFELSAVATSTGDTRLFFSDGADGLMLKFDSDHKLIWSTCYGGAKEDGITNLDIDQSGNLFTVGLTKSYNLPTMDPTGTTDYFDGTLSGDADAFLMQFNNSGEQVWGTYYGGTGDERGYQGYWYGLPWYINSVGVIGGSLITDSYGNLYVTGATTSNDNAMILHPTGNAYNQTSNGGFSDAWLAKFSPGLERKWSTYFGGGAMEYANDICVDNIGLIYICGTANLSANGTPFNTTNPPANTYTHASSGMNECFINVFTPWGTNLWGSYFGGSSNGNFGDLGICMTVDNAPFMNQVVVYGMTESADFVHEFPGGGVYDQPNGLSGYGDATVTRFLTDALRIVSINVDQIPKEIDSMNIFPNPSTDFCELIFASKTNTQKSLTVIDQLGRQLKRISLGEMSGVINYKLDVSDIPVGIYNITIEDDGSSINNRFIKN